MDSATAICTAIRHSDEILKGWCTMCRKSRIHSDAAIDIPSIGYLLLIFSHSTGVGANPPRAGNGKVYTMALPGKAPLKAEVTSRRNLMPAAFHFAGDQEGQLHQIGRAHV